MKKKLQVMTVLLFVLAPPRGATAQGGHMNGDQYRIAVGFGGGLSIPTSDAKDAFKNGMNGEGFVKIRLPMGLPALRFNLGYQKFDFKDALSGVTGGNTTATNGASDRILSGVGGLSFDLIGGPIRPYIMAGLGAFNVKTSYASGITSGTGGTDGPSETNFGIDGGAGLSLNLGPISGFAEGKLQNIYTKNKGVVNTKSITSVPVTFGLMIGF